MLRAGRPHLAALTVLGCLALTLPALAAAATPEYFDVPKGVTTEFGLATESNGTVWFPANTNATQTPGIGRLVPGEAAAGTSDGLTVYPTPKPAKEPYPCCANWVRNVAVDASHNRIWFVQTEGVVGYAETAKLVPGASTGMAATRIEVDEDLWDVAFSPSTNLAWFTENGASNEPPYQGSRIGSIDENLNVHQLNNLAIQGGGAPSEPEFAERYAPQPEGITVDASGKPWFAEASTTSGFRLGTAPAAGGEGPYSEYELEPCPQEDGCPAPTSVAISPDGAVWYTVPLTNEVGRLNAAHDAFEDFSMTAIDSTLAEGKPTDIVAAPDGTIWVAESGYYGHGAANALIRIVPGATPTTTVYHLGSGYAPGGIAADTKGNVWFTATSETSSPEAIGRLAGVVGGSLVSEIAQTGTTTTPITTPTEKAITPVSRGTAKVGAPIPKGSSVTSEQICLGPPSDPCAVVYLLSAGEYVTGFPGTKASIAKKRRGVVLGRTAVTLHGGQHRKITVKLNAAGLRMLKRKHRLVVYFTATQAGLGNSPPKLLKRAKIVLHYRR